MAQDQQRRHHLIRKPGSPAPAQIHSIRTCLLTRSPSDRTRTEGQDTLTRAAGKFSVLAGFGLSGATHQACAGVAGLSRRVGRAVTHLEHVVDDIELDDRLPPYQVIHHGVVDIVHHKIADYQKDTFQNVTHLGRLQQTSVPATYEK